MTQTAKYGLSGYRIHPHGCLGTSSEIHAAGEREVRVFKGFRCRLSILTTRGIKSFVVFSKRWIVERAFAWLDRHLRHSKDYKNTTTSSETFTYIPMIYLMSKRLLALTTEFQNMF